LRAPATGPFLERSVYMNTLLVLTCLFYFLVLFAFMLFGFFILHKPSHFFEWFLASLIWPLTVVSLAYDGFRRRLCSKQ